jgi:hypothetical protein
MHKAHTMLFRGAPDAWRRSGPLQSSAAGSHLKTANLLLIPGATRVFEEPGTLEMVVEEAVTWFNRCFGALGVHQPLSWKVMKLATSRSAR